MVKIENLCDFQVKIWTFWFSEWNWSSAFGWEKWKKSEKNSLKKNLEDPNKLKNLLYSNKSGKSGESGESVSPTVVSFKKKSL